MISKNNAILALTLALTLLTGCKSVSDVEKSELNIYQPPILRLEAGTKVLTKDGWYTAQQDEIWHSDMRYRLLERED